MIPSTRDTPREGRDLTEEGVGEYQGCSEEISTWLEEFKEKYERTVMVKSLTSVDK